MTLNYPPRKPLAYFLGHDSHYKGIIKLMNFLGDNECSFAAVDDEKTICQDYSLTSLLIV